MNVTYTGSAFLVPPLCVGPGRPVCMLRSPWRSFSASPPHSTPLLTGPAKRGEDPVLTVVPFTAVTPLPGWYLFPVRRWVISLSRYCLPRSGTSSHPLAALRSMARTGALSLLGPSFSPAQLAEGPISADARAGPPGPCPTARLRSTRAGSPGFNDHLAAQPVRSPCYYF